ncbi:MAG: hypothetical protein HY081_04840 [Gammaproteobacteria bacterium]|nr:hypothetical protein [Gammaproteobacteria bacterium]
MTIGLLIIALLVILIGAETFTNALEHLGERLKISEGVTGSIFAAVGTALPETMVPVVAIFSSASTQAVREEVGVGAILGAPLMLSTLTMFLMAVFAIQRRGWQDHFHPEHSGIQRDLTWFLLAFGLSTVAIFVPHQVTWVRAGLAISLVLVYFVYLLLTIRASSKLVAAGHGTEAEEPLFLVRFFGRLGVPENLLTVLVQLGIGLGLIIFGAHGFVQGVEHHAAPREFATRAFIFQRIVLPRLSSYCSCLNV